MNDSDSKKTPYQIKSRVVAWRSVTETNSFTDLFLRPMDVLKMSLAPDMEEWSHVLVTTERTE